MLNLLASFLCHLLLLLDLTSSTSYYYCPDSDATLPAIMSSFIPQGLRDSLRNKGQEFLSSGSQQGQHHANPQYPGNHSQQQQHPYPPQPYGGPSYAGGGSNSHGESNIGPEMILNSTNSTYPRLCRLSDSSILLGYTSTGPDNTRILHVSRSVDNGASFMPWGEVTRGGRGNDTDNLFLLELPPSPSSPPRLLAAFRNHDRDPGNGTITHYRITVCTSLDGGRSWTYLSQAAEFSPTPNLLGVWEPFLRLAKDGSTVQITYSLELAHDDQDTRMKYSSDGGRTWSQPRTVTGQGERLRDGMNGIARTQDRGRDALVMVFETTRRGPFSVECVLSSDDGLSWGARQDVFVPSSPPGRNAGSPQIESFSDGSLVAIFMSDVDAERVDWPRGASIFVAFADPPVDGRLVWGGVRKISEAGCFWPGIFRRDGDDLVAVYEQNGAIKGHPISRPGRRP